MARFWDDVAVVCRYGHQDVYRITGRDPVTRPLTSLELHLFRRKLLEYVEAEVTPRVEERALGVSRPVG